MDYSATLTVRKLDEGDRDAWEPLARGYKHFYETTLADAVYESTWARLLRDDEIHGLIAHVDGRPAGIVHYLFHSNVWSPDVCYLQDLFVAEDARGHGVGEALIQAVAHAARARNAPRLYWLTREDNGRARRLYDRVARFKGFLRYDFSFPE